MSNVLVVNSSALGRASVSNQLVQDTLARLRARDPELEVTMRNLGTNPAQYGLGNGVVRHCASERRGSASMAASWICQPLCGPSGRSVRAS
jgi:FMN-dependent NADH-azoreductase